VAAPALADDKVEGDGYEFRLPPGFTEVMSMENSGSMRVKSTFGCLPVEGMPEMKAYMAGGGTSPDGVIVVARVNLSRKITTAGELGLDQMEKMKEQLPDGVDIHATTIGGCEAVEITLQQEDYNGSRTSRIASIAGGDYVVVLMMTTSDEAYSTSAMMWSSLTSSMKVEPGINKLLLFGIVGVAGLFGLWWLSRVSSRPTHEIPAVTGRFKRDGAAPTGPGLPPRDKLEVGKRPKVLSSRPVMDAPEPGRLGMPAQSGAPSKVARGIGFADDGASTPCRTATSPAVTRPAAVKQASRSGLRPTRPDGARWGT
jgi:hypothetical protein